MQPKIILSKQSNKSKQQIESDDIDDEQEWINHCSILGRRETNEDAFVSFNTNNLLIAGLFDGHNGKNVSQLCQRSLQQCCTSLLKQYQDEIYVQKNKQQNNKAYNEIMGKILTETIKKLEQKCIDQQILESGSTAVIVVVDQQNNMISIANVGDSCCIIGYNNDQKYKQQLLNGEKTAIPLEQLITRYYNYILQPFETTKPHKPTDKDEYQRILNCGGQIVDVYDIQRIDGKLAVSRAIGNIGDKTLKAHGVISTPDIYSFPLNHATFIMLSCDGLTDVLQPKEINACINTAIFLRVYRHSLRNLCKNNCINDKKQGFESNTSKAIINYFLNGLESDLNNQNHEIQEIISIIKQFIQHFLNFSPTVNTIQVQNKQVQVFENVQPDAPLQLRISQALTKYAYFLDSNDNVSVALAIIDKTI